MPKTHHQQMPHPPIRFLIWLLGVVIIVICFQGIVLLSTLAPPFLQGGILWLSLGTIFYWTYISVYYKLAAYNYSLYDTQLVIERVVGRSNHAAIVIDLKDVIDFKAYTNQRISRRDRFYHQGPTQAPYVLSFRYQQRVRHISLTPDAIIQSAIQEARGNAFIEGSAQ